MSKSKRKQCDEPLSCETLKQYVVLIEIEIKFCHEILHKAIKLEIYKL